MIRKIIEHHPDRRVADPGFLRQVGEGMAERPFLKPTLESRGHGPFGVNIRKRLVKGLPTSLTLESPGIDGETDSFPMDGEIANPVLPMTETDQSIGLSQWGQHSGGETVSTLTW